MILKTFIDNEMKKILSFNDFWRRNSKKTPDVFPELLDDEAWEEQYRIYKEYVYKD